MSLPKALSNDPFWNGGQVRLESGFWDGPEKPRFEATVDGITKIGVRRPPQADVPRQETRWRGMAKKLDRQLLDAAENGDVDEIKSLLAQGASLECRDGNGYTPLLLASGEGHLDACRMLIDAGSSIEATTLQGASAVDVAASGGSVDVLGLLYELGASINSRDRQGDTPLMSAVGSHQEETARWLLEHGADVNSANDDGTTALHLAHAMSLNYEEEGGSPFIPLLEEHGADKTIMDKRGRVPTDFPTR